MPKRQWRKYHIKFPNDTEYGWCRIGYVIICITHGQRMANTRVAAERCRQYHAFQTGCNLGWGGAEVWRLFGSMAIGADSGDPEPLKYVTLCMAHKQRGDWTMRSFKSHADAMVDVNEHLRANQACRKFFWVPRTLD